MSSESSLRARPAAPIRAFNRVAAGRAPSLLPVDADGIRRRAERSTGLSDWGDPSVHQRLDRMGAAIHDNPNLSAFGRIAVGLYYQHHAVNRLRVVDWIAREPAILEEPIEAPIFVVGLYRTGTTTLHNLLDANPALRTPLFYDLLTPYPPTGRASIDVLAKKARAQTLLPFSRLAIPEQQAAHVVPLDGPEECFFLLENSFASSTAYNTYQAYDYAWWLLEQDLRPDYEFLRTQLQCLQYGRARQTWALKCPFHLWHLRALLEVFPDARLVFTHRDVGKAIPSNCSLSAMTTSKLAESIDLHALGDFWLRYSKAGLQRASEVRRTLPTGQVFDVPLPRLSAAPKETLRALHAHFDLDTPRDLDARIDARLAANPQRTTGKHQYSPELFGLNADGIRRELSTHHEWYETLAAC